MIGRAAARRRAGLIAVTVSLVLAIPSVQAGAAASAPPTHAARASIFSAAQGPSPQPGVDKKTADESGDFAVTPLVGPAVREFVESGAEADRSSRLARIVVPLVLILLIERELLASLGRPEARAFRFYGLPLIACFAMIVVAQLRQYIG